jgi:tetratricopeptide (TPR) repeat protein
MVKCTCCGANVSIRDRACSYCGTTNPGYLPPGDEINQLLDDALAAYQHQRYKAAVDCYRHAIELGPDVFDAYFYSAASLTMLEQREEAIEEMIKAQNIRPGNAAICFNLGVLNKQLGHKDEARPYLEKALKLVDTGTAIQNKPQMKQTIQKELVEYKHWKLFG